MVGLASISSFESNAMVASDEGVVRGLVWGVGREDRKVAKAAVDAVMDLATSPVGRERLMRCCAVEKLLYVSFLTLLISVDFFLFFCIF